jgi:hypothetical protein
MGLIRIIRGLRFEADQRQGKSQKAKVREYGGRVMGFGMQGISESGRFFVGLDLGQSQDHSALAVVERDEIFEGEMDYATYERPRVRRFRMRFLEQLALGTSYPTVVERVRQVVRQRPLMGRCTLVMDATGVGAPVLDLMRVANLGCGIVPVNLTGGERESQTGGLWNVPKQVLISGLLVMLEKKDLALSMRVASARVLDKELAGMEARVSRSGQLNFGTREGEHDDVVIAAALACWRARWRSEGMWGTKRLGIEY